MKRQDKIIIKATAEDVRDALIKVNKIPINYELEKFSYTLKRINLDAEAYYKALSDFKDYDIIDCELILKKEDYNE